jgi:polar amino acid transport system substrate-binding protein
VLLQEGKVDALSGDDTVLAGFVAQDPNVEIVGDRFTPEPYGIGLPPEQGDWVRYVNGVLDEVRTSGRWRELYDRYLAGPLNDPDAQPPQPQYDG